jgi:membrane associated rhomboid family serine protease
MEFNVTIIIIIATCLVSFAAFNNNDLRNKMIFYPYGMNGHPNEYHRFLTGGFLHADLTHLIFNMMSLYFFGPAVEKLFMQDLGLGKTIYLIFYLSAIVVAGIPSYLKQRNNANYMALGASGAVSAIIFASIMFQPVENGISLMMIPVFVKAYAFGILYLIFSAYMAKRGKGNIGHDAHFWGGVYGLLFPLLFKPDLLQTFMQKIAASPSPFMSH